MESTILKPKLKERDKEIRIGIIVFISIMVFLHIFWPLFHNMNATREYKALLIENRIPIEFFVEPKYEQILPFSGGKAVLIDRGYVFIIDTSGHIRPFDETVDSAYFNALSQATSDENVIEGLEDLYSQIGAFSEGLAPVVISGYHDDEGNRTRSKYGYINTFGREAIAPRFDRVGHFRNGFAIVGEDFFSNEDRWEMEYLYGLIDKNGDLVIDCKYLRLGYYANGLIAFSTEKVSVGSEFHFNSHDYLTRNQTIRYADQPLYGFMDIDENVIIQPRFVDTPVFSRQATRVFSSFAESSAPVFSEGVAWVTPYDCELKRASDVKYLIDMQGNTLFELSNRYKASESIEGFMIITDHMSDKQGLIRTPK